MPDDNIVQLADYRGRIRIATDAENLYSVVPDSIVVQGYSHREAAWLAFQMLSNGIRVADGTKIVLEVAPLPPTPEPEPYAPTVIDGGARRTWWTRVRALFRRKPKVLT